MTITWSPTCSGQAMPDVISGRVSMMFENMPGAVGHIKAGKVRVLAVTGLQRTPALPEVKTVAGSFKTMRYEVFLFGGVIYRRPAKVLVWISEDQRRLPVQIRVRLQLAIGSITLLLEKEDHT